MILCDWFHLKFILLQRYVVICPEVSFFDCLRCFWPVSEPRWAKCISSQFLARRVVKALKPSRQSPPGCTLHQFFHQNHQHYILISYKVLRCSKVFWGFWFLKLFLLRSVFFVVFHWIFTVAPPLRPGQWHHCTHGNLRILFSVNLCPFQSVSISVSINFVQSVSKALTQWLSFKQALHTSVQLQKRLQTLKLANDQAVVVGTKPFNCRGWNRAEDRDGGRRSVNRKTRNEDLHLSSPLPVTVTPCPHVQMPVDGRWVEPIPANRTWWSWPCGLV